MNNPRSLAAGVFLTLARDVSTHFLRTGQLPPPATHFVDHLFDVPRCNYPQKHLGYFKCITQGALMTDTYTPPKVWTWNQGNGGEFASINRPIAGATHDKDLAVGDHPLQLYSLATPNGVKVTVMLEELLAAGHAGAEYDAWLINIGEGDQFSSGFVSVTPSSKIPALMDHSTAADN
mgnify:CR=1 FL=1